MYTSVSFLAGVLSIFLSAVPISAFQQAVYWGQSGQTNLSHFCSDSQGIDIIPLAFLSQFGGSNTPDGGFGGCSITEPSSAACQQVAQDVEYCQSQNKTVLLSLGGAAGSYGLSSQSDAEALAQNLWATYGPVQESYNGSRPLGTTVLDGFDLDIENNVGSYNYVFLIWKLRELFATDPSRTYYISGAPQCVVPDASMGDMIFNSPFDYLFVQYYNTPTCSARGKISGYSSANGQNQYFTFDAWKEVTGVNSSQSTAAKMFIGLPAAPGAASESYYLEPNEALELVNEYKSHEGFAGVMLWDAGSSDSNVVNGCTYSQQISRILTKGETC